MSLCDILGKKFVVTAEVSMPEYGGVERAVEEARTMARFADAIGVADSPRGKVKVSPISMARLLLDEGIEPVVHVACSNRNRVALMSDIFGGLALGVRDFLAVTGDHPVQGDMPGARPVFDLDSLGLLAEMKGLPGICPGAVVNPYGVPGDLIVERLHAKEEAGARFIMTQPVFDTHGFEGFLDRVGSIDAAIIPSVMVLGSKRQAEFVKTKVPGVSLAEDVYRRIIGARDPEKEGAGVAAETIGALRELDRVGGVNIVPMGNVETAVGILEGAGFAWRS